MKREHLLEMLGAARVRLPIKIRGLTPDERSEFMTRWAANPSDAHAWLIVRAAVDGQFKSILNPEDVSLASTWNRTTVTETVQRILAAPGPQEG